MVRILCNLIVLICNFLKYPDDSFEAVDHSCDLLDSEEFQKSDCLLYLGKLPDDSIEAALHSSDFLDILENQKHQNYSIEVGVHSNDFLDFPDDSVEARHVRSMELLDFLQEVDQAPVDFDNQP